MKTRDLDAGVKPAREAEKAPSYPADLPPQHTSHQESPLSHHLKEKTFKLNVPPFYFLCISLWLLDSLLLYFFFLNNSMFTSCQLVACSTF